MRTIVIGLGIQGHKRRAFAGSDYVASVDPLNAAAEFRCVEDVPVSDYDSALVCTPDEPKIEVLSYLLKQGKHVLVEKPLRAMQDRQIEQLEQLARDRGVVCYTAYNHRFEPHCIRMRDLIASGGLGSIYRCRMFYGNGTARLVRQSDWRDRNAGVLPDLGSHLLDTARFWFGDIGEDFHIVSANRFENRAPDHVVMVSKTATPTLEFEVTLLSWRNDFTCDIFAEKGTAHIRSLCKWGPATFTHRARVLPAGRPAEESFSTTGEDPTWALEYGHFKALCERGASTDLSTDRWLNRVLNTLAREAEAEASI